MDGLTRDRSYWNWNWHWIGIGIGIGLALDLIDMKSQGLCLSLFPN